MYKKMMRCLAGASLLVLASVGLEQASAAPIHHVINFTPVSGSAPASGSFTYDADITTFTDFLVSWEGISFDLTASANAPVLGGALSCLGGNTGAAATFAVLSGGCDGNVPAPQWRGNHFGVNAAFRFEIVAAIALGGADTFEIGGFEGGLPDTIALANGQWDLDGGGPTSVPEPGSLTLSLSALLALGYFGHKRRSAARN